MTVISFSSKNNKPKQVTEVKTTVTETKLVVQPHRGAYSHCANIETTPSGVVKPAHCGVHAVYHTQVNDEAPKLLCPQCTTKLERLHTPELFDPQDV